MAHRYAVTLIEVLVSIFIMGIGLLALLTLFPLGALTMAQAIKDDRVAQAAANAEAIAVFRDVRHTGWVAISPDDTGGIDRVFFGPTRHPLRTTPVTPWPDLRNFPGGLDGPSYPVYIDPFGILGTQNRPLGAVLDSSGQLLSHGIPRRNVSFVGTSFPNALRWFSLLDEMDFNEDGLPKQLGGVVQREPQYTWAFLLRRPQASVAAVVDLSVVVYSGRPLQLLPEESVYHWVEFNVNSPEVELRFPPGGRPPVRKGGWVLDATVLNEAGNGPDPHGFFYRVVNVTDLPRVSGQDGVMLELETKPRLGTRRGVLVVMEHVAEVLEKTGDWRP